MKNIYFGKRKFFNFSKGRNKDHFFLFPSLIFTHEKRISWDLVKGSVTLAFLVWYFQINIFNIVQNSSKEIFKQDVASIIKILKDSKYAIKDMNLLIKFLQDNIYLVQLVKNINIEHPYVKKVILYYFKNCDFIIQEE